jgi:hypothetical protein
VTRDVQWSETTLTPPSIDGDVASDAMKPRYALSSRWHRSRGKRGTQDRFLCDVLSLVRIDAAAK